MVRRLALFVFAVAVLVMTLPPAGAVEPGLAGIRLGQQVMELFNQKPYGPPEFFGPPGAVITHGVPGAQPGMPALGIPQAPAVGPVVPMLRFGARVEEDDDRWGGGPGYSAAPAMPAPVAPTPQAAGTQMFWLYRMPGDATVVVGFDTKGKVTTIAVAGRSYPVAVTAGGVKLGDSYVSILDKYGFPDSTAGAGGNLVLQYNNAGLTLILANLRVASITLAEPGAAVAAPGVPLTVGQPAAPLAPGVAPAPPAPAGGLPRIGFGRRDD